LRLEDFTSSICKRALDASLDTLGISSAAAENFLFQVTELLQQLAEAQCAFDRCSRDKMSIAAELDVARSQLDSVDTDYSKVLNILVTSVLCVCCHCVRLLSVLLLFRLLLWFFD
jgi:hypothetical protein